MNKEQLDMFTQMAKSSINEALLNIDECKQMIEYTQNEIESMSDRDKASTKFDFHNYRLKLYTKSMQALKDKIIFIKEQYQQMTGQSI